jgi:hypothetical protein
MPPTSLLDIVKRVDGFEDGNDLTSNGADWYGMARFSVGHVFFTMQFYEI